MIFFVTNKNIYSCNSSLVGKFIVNQQEYLWLIDTGASISAIQQKYVAKLNIPFYKGKCTVNGIGGSIEAIGYVVLQLVANGETFHHKIYVFDSLPCLANGILGNDFLSKYKTVLDYNSGTLSLTAKSGMKICLSLYDIDNKKISLNIPPRSESIHYIKTSMTDDCVVCTDEIYSGIFLANTIVTPVNGMIPVKILNTTENKVKITELKPQLERLKDYNLCTFNKTRSNADRVKELFSYLHLNHLNKEEKITIESLCAKFSDIFQLPNDKLTTTNICKQNIHLKPNSSPFFVKPYRIPHSQKQELNKQINKLLENGIIEPAKSEWSSPVLLFPKKSVV